MYEMWDAAAGNTLFLKQKKKNASEVYPFIYMSHVNYT